MAEYYLDGDDFTVVTDWQTLAGADAAEYPGQTQTDNIWVTERMGENLTAHVNQAANPNGIENLTLAAGAAYSIGSKAAPLTLKLAATPELVFGNDQAGCQAWIVTKTTAVTKATVARTGSHADALHLVFDDAACTLLDILGGNVTLDQYLNQLDSLGVATLNVKTGPAGQSPNVALWAPVGTALNIYSGTVYWHSGTLAQINLYGGALYASRSQLARTCTNMTYYGGVADFRTGNRGCLTFSNALSIKAADTSQLFFDGGQAVTLTT